MHNLGYRSSFSVRSKAKDTGQPSLSKTHSSRAREFSFQKPPKGPASIGPGTKGPEYERSGDERSGVLKVRQRKVRQRKVRPQNIRKKYFDNKMKYFIFVNISKHPISKKTNILIKEKKAMKNAIDHATPNITLCRFR
jgi:hypothetical protein